eukprot:XP_001694092.1 predicted protein [Chlamydomonas reinhardtii]
MNPGDEQGRGAVHAAFTGPQHSSYAATAVSTAVDPTTGRPFTTYRNMAVGAVSDPAGGTTTVAYQFQQQTPMTGGAMDPAMAATAAAYPYAALKAGGGATLQDDDYKEDDYVGVRGGGVRAYDPEAPMAGDDDNDDDGGDVDADDDLIEDDNAAEAAGPLQDVYEPDVVADRGGFAYGQAAAAPSWGGASDVSAMLGGTSSLAGGDSQPSGLQCMQLVSGHAGHPLANSVPVSCMAAKCGTVSDLADLSDPRDVPLG